MLIDREKDDVSLLGKGVRRAVKIVNHLPRIGYLAQNGELRKRLTEREKEWICPKGMMRTVYDQGDYSMELLTGQIQDEEDEGQKNQEDHKLLRLDLLSKIHGREKDKDKAESEGSDNEAVRSENLTEEPQITDQQTDQVEEPEKELTERKLGDQWLIFHLHGGGYYGRLHNTYRDMAAVYHEVSGGYDVLSVDYRVAPEHPFPAALDDAVSAYQWALEQGYPAEKILIVGDSAGGGLTLAVTMYLRDHGIPMPAAVITMSAWTDLTKSGWSYEEKFHEDPVFGDSKETLVYKEGYITGNDPMNPYISPVFGDYTGFPPMLMQVGEMEMLLSDTLTVADHAREQGVDIIQHTYTGMFHDFQMGFMLYQESRDAWNEIEEFITRIKTGNPD